MKRGHQPKTELTPIEKLQVAFGHLMHGIDQHALASLYGVNPGRISAAIADVKTAIGFDAVEEEQANV